MVTLQKINAELFPTLYRSFLIDDDPHSGEAEWRSVFDYQWEKPTDHCGYALLNGEELVGMLGMVFSERHIDGQLRPFCNLHTWWVREDHRGHSLALLRPILKLQDFTLTHFTPCDTVRAVCKRLGFKELSSQLTILLPLPRRWRRRLPAAGELTFDEGEMEPYLNEADRRILRDHRPYRSGNLLLQKGDASCYLLYTHVVRHRLPYCHIHYVSNLELFAEHEREIRSALLDRHRTSFVAIDTRLVEGLTLRRSFRFWAPANALFKSNEVLPHQIDNLYSDVVMLRLTTLPDLSHEIGGLLRRIARKRDRASIPAK